MSITTNLGRYRYISSLGSGGMSTVVLAEDTLLGRRVALKRMHDGDDVRRGSRLRREALIGASVTHPNLVPIYDIVTAENGESVIVMEYVEGETLRDAVRREGRLSVPFVLRVLEGVAGALDAIHAAGIVHRDVKPANILLGRDGAIKLADLGVASAPDRTRITTEGGLVGTFSYMAPEQLGGAPATRAVDVYALAAVAFEALSGRKARTEPNPLALAHAIATGPPPDLRKAWPQAPPGAAKLLMRGMSRNPKDRPASAGELVSRLSEALAPLTAPAEPATPAPQPQPAPSVAPPPPRRNRDPRLRLAAALIPLIALAIAVAAIAASTGSGPSSHTRTTAARSHPTATTRSRPTATTRSAPAAHAAPPTHSSAAASAAPLAAPSAATGGPASAVERFYALAAGHQYAAAWALTDPAFQRQLGGYRSFQYTVAADRSIAFDSVRTVSQSPDAAVVAVRTTSFRTDGTQHCAGTVQLVPDGRGAWLLHQIAIGCS